MIKSLIMKIILFITLTIFGASFTSQVLAQTSNPNYDSQLTAKLGGNEYGMKIYILDVETIKEADALLETDPDIKEGYLKAEFYKWYGSAALSEYLDSSDKIWKINP